VTRRSLGLAILLAAAIAGAVGLVLGSRLLRPPEATLLPPSDVGAGLRFQQSVAQLLLRQGGVSQRNDPVVVTASEVNAFLARHVAVRRRVTVWPLVVRVEDGWLEVAGRTSLRRVLERASIGWLDYVVPGTLLDLDVWLAAQGRLRVGDGAGELLVDRAAVGRQTVPQGWLWRLLGADPSELLAWRMPSIVERVQLEPGRLVLHTRRRDG